MSIKMAIDTYPSPWRQKRRPKVHSRSETDVSPAIKRPLKHVGINTFYVEILSKVMMDRELECWGTLMGNAVRPVLIVYKYQLQIANLPLICDVICILRSLSLTNRVSQS